MRQSKPQPPTRDVSASDWQVRLDLTPQVLRIEVPEYVSGVRGRTAAEELLPTLPLPQGSPVSAATLLLKAKQLDDGLYAAVELAAQQGAGRFPGKASLLRSLAQTLAAGPEGRAPAAALIYAACELGRIPAAPHEGLREDVRGVIERFLADEAQSKPLGFYTWTPELAAIFRQDRLLQQLLDPRLAEDLGRAVEQTPGAAEAHAACLRLNELLTNPAKRLRVQHAGKRQPFFPPSRSHEVSLFEGLYGDRPIPEGFDLMGELIRAVRLGEIRLGPTDTSGWYDYQTWSLEPLLVPDRAPEKDHLELGKRYRGHLEDLFRGALALARETHVKQAGGGYGGGGRVQQQPIRVRPELSVEPLPEVYRRRASSYAFVRSVLEEAFGSDALARMRRLTAEGPAAVSLADELGWTERLFAGAAATACRELGMEPAPGDEETVRCFADWREGLRTDRDVSRDARMMVPVFFDLGRRKTKVWAFLGWKTVPVDVGFREEPRVLSVWRVGRQGTTQRRPVEFTVARYELATPVLAEVYVEQVLDRDEFRRHCDRFKTREAILANLR